MWYLIAIDIDCFVRVETQQDDIHYEKEGTEDGIPVISVSEGEKYYSFELLDDNPDADFLTELNKLNPKGFILLNHCAVLLKWNEELGNLKTRLTSILSKKDKYAVFPIKELSFSNFLPNAFVNQKLKS